MLFQCTSPKAEVYIEVQPRETSTKHYFHVHLLKFLTGLQQNIRHNSSSSEMFIFSYLIIYAASLHQQIWHIPSKFHRWTATFFKSPLPRSLDNSMRQEYTAIFFSRWLSVCRSVKIIALFTNLRYNLQVNTFIVTGFIVINLKYTILLSRIKLHEKLLA